MEWEVEGEVVLRVEGWKEAKPVTVDKIGTFFRNVSALRNASSLTEVPPARIVFEVKMQGSAQKLIIVRSALEIENRLSVPIRIRLENTALKVADVKEMEVIPSTKHTAEFAADPRPWQRMSRERAKRTMLFTVRK